jgi:hypothetical protein
MSSEERVTRVVVDSRTLDVDETNHVIQIPPPFLLRLTFRSLNLNLIH